MLFGQKRMYPENNSGRECCWPYLIGQHPLSPVFGQKRPGTPGNSYFAQLPPVFGHFMFLSGGLLDYSNRSTWATRFLGGESYRRLHEWSEAYFVTLIDRCSFLCVSGQRGTIAKSMHEEHLFIVALTSNYSRLCELRIDCLIEDG